MAKHLVVVKSKAVDGREADFEAWYNGIHLGEVLALPGFITGQQFRYGPDGAPFTHFAVFDVESDDIEAEVKRLQALGAEVVERMERWVVMEAPSKHRFCIINPIRPDFDEHANVWE